MSKKCQCGSVGPVSFKWFGSSIVSLYNYWYDDGFDVMVCA